MTYASRPPADALRAVVRCVWIHELAPGAPPFRVLPDACIDVVWDGVALSVAGPDTGPVLAQLPDGARVAGVRFHPGAAPVILGVPASALRDARVALHELWGDDARRLADDLGAAGSTWARAALIERAIATRMPGSRAPDALVREVVRRMSPPRGGAAPSIAALAADLGVSSRQLLRRCTEAVGYRPKLIERVLRFQGFLRQLRARPDLPLARLAADAGYADQAHLAHETAALAGLSPLALRDARR